MNKLIALAFLMATPFARAQQVTNPSQLWDPSPLGFSHVAVMPAGHKVVFVAGQGGEMDLNGTLAQNFEGQIDQALKNVKIALESQGLTMDQVAKVTTLVVDHDQEKLEMIVNAFKSYWPDKNFPTNTLIPVPKLAMDAMLVEIEAIAVKR